MNRICALILCCILLLQSGCAVAQPGAGRVSGDQPQTKLILLGTGTPRSDPDHSGCSLAIVVGDTPYIIDFGPGLIRQAGVGAQMTVWKSFVA